MGIIDTVAGRIRGYFDSERRRDARSIAVGGTGTSALGSGFDLLSAYGYDALTQYLQLDHGLLERYADYEEMDDYPIISSALDIFADDSTQTDTQSNRMMWVSAKDLRVQTILDDLFHRTLRIEEELWEITRTLCKYGSDFEEPLITEEGVVGLNFLPPVTMRRVEGPRGELFGFIQDFHGKVGFTLDEFAAMLNQRNERPEEPVGPQGLSTFDPGRDMEFQVALEDWECIHFRLRGKHRRSVYGFSVLEPARFIYRRLMLLEDAAMIYRLQRAPEKLAYYVDVGNLPPAEALAHVRQVRNMHKKKKYVNPTTGRIELKMDAFAPDDDIWVPTRQGKDSTRVETLTSPSWQHMEDVNYFRDQLFAAIKVPKAYLGGDDGLVHKVLASEDVRFARTVLRVQRAVKNGLEQIGRLHLAAIGIHPDYADFEVHMTVPSAIFELAQLEARNARADLAGRMAEFVSMPWLLKDVFGMSDQDVTRIFKEREEDAYREAFRQAGSQAAAAKKFGDPNAPPGGDAGGGAPPPPEGPPGGAPHTGPGTGSPLSSNRGRWPFQTPRPTHRTSFRESELQPPRGADARKANAALEKVLKRDAALARQLHEIRGLLDDLSARPRH